MTTYCDIDYLESRINFLYDKYNAGAGAGANTETIEDKDKDVESNSSSESAEKKNKKKYVRKSPNDLAKNYDIGTTKVSENDGKTYKVVEVSGEKRTMKRWVLQK